MPREFNLYPMENKMSIIDIQSLENEKIINRIKKLINLAENEGATEGERDNALRMAHATLAKYNLAMSDIEGSEPEENRIELQFDAYNSKAFKTVCNSAAKLYFCKCFTSKMSPGEVKNWRKRCHYYFIGRESNTITAKLMAEYLIKSIEREQRKLGAGESFNLGAAYAIANRVENIIENKEPNSEFSESTALAVVSLHKSEQSANDNYLANKGIVLVSKRQRQVNINNWEDYSKGTNFGENINLNNQISGKKQTAIGN